MGLHYTVDYHKAIISGAEHKDGIRWQTHQATIARYKQEGTLLDVGCSSGSFLARMNNGHWKLFGIEMDSATAERAKLSSGAEVFVGDIMKAPFPPNSFDVITAFDVLEHMDRPREFLELIHYWLRPGGIFFGKVPNIDSWEARLFGTYWYGLELPRHLYHFSQRSMAQLVAEVGFRESFITATSEGSHAHHSARYLLEAFLEKLNFSPTPMAKAGPANLIWRAIRKGLWLSIVVPLSRLASAANAGVVIDVILNK
jgi:SAM-dependent methyltransferase